MKLTTLIVFVAVGQLSWQMSRASELEAALKGFAAYDYGQPKKALHETRMAAFRGTQDEARRAENEKLLLAFVQSDAPVAARRQACLWLCDLGSEASTAALTTLSAQDDFADVAQMALDGLKPPQPAPSIEPSSSPGRFRSTVMKAENQAALLIAALQGDDDSEARLAFDLIGEGVAAKDACAWLGANVEKLSESRQVIAIHLLLHLNATEKETVITALSRNGQGRGKLAAVRNLGNLGRGEDLEFIDGLLFAGDAELAEAARQSMTVCPARWWGTFS